MIPKAFLAGMMRKGLVSVEGSEVGVMVDATFSLGALVSCGSADNRGVSRVQTARMPDNGMEARRNMSADGTMRHGTPQGADGCMGCGRFPGR